VNESNKIKHHVFLFNIDNNETRNLCQEYHELSRIILFLCQAKNERINSTITHNMLLRRKEGIPIILFYRRLSLC